MTINEKKSAWRPGAGKIRCFLVEDSDVVRAALRAILGGSRDFEVVGEAVDGNTAISRIALAKPDVVLVDIGLPGTSGIEVTKQVKSRGDNIKVLIFTSQEFDRDMFDAFSAGADGYVLKRDFQKSALENAIRDVMQGSSFIDPAVAERVLAFSRLFNKAVPGGIKATSPQPLTQQEEQALDRALKTDGACAVEPGVLAALQRFAKAHV